MPSSRDPLLRSDGAVPARLVAATAHSLRVGDWVCLEGRPYQIGDLRFRTDGARVVHLLGHTPLVLAARHTLLVYTPLTPRG